MIGSVDGPVVAAMGAAWGGLVAWPLMRRASRSPLHDRAIALRPAPRPSGRGRVRARHRKIGAPLQWWFARRRRRARHDAIERTLPLALDVLTVAARAGYTSRLALQATARWSSADLGAAFGAVEARCQLGAGLARSLDELAAQEPVLAPVAEALAVAERSGAPTADLLARLADECRAGFRRRAEAHARRVPVRLLFPLVFLVLPAFGLLTVVPALMLGLRDH